MKRVFLIRPRWEYPHSAGDDTYNTIWFPLSLGYCSALLKENGFDTRIYDFHGSRNLDIRTVLSEIRADDVVFVTSSGLDRWACPPLDLEPVHKIVTSVRSRTENIYVMGPHGTMNPEALLTSTGARAVIRGEPEYTVLNLVRHDTLSAVSGISFMDAGKVIHNEDSKDIDLNNLPVPDFSLFQQVNYFYEIFGDRFALFETSRNCPYQCTFCMKLMHGKKYRLKSINRVIEEIKASMRYGVKRGYFIDLELGVNKTHLVNLCNALRKEVPGFEWCCQTRADDLDKGLIKLMAKSGCKIIHFGIESGNQRTVDSLNKRLNLNKVKEVVALCKKHNITTVGMFLMGLPQESWGDSKRTIKFALEVRPTYIAFPKVVAYRGTLLFADSGAREQFFSLVHLEGKSKSLNRLKTKAYLKHYLRLSFLKQWLASGGPRWIALQIRFFLSFLR